MRFFTVLSAFGLATLFRLRTGVSFFTGDVTVKTYIFVVAPLAFGAFLIAFMIHQTNVFDAIGNHRGFADTGVISAVKN
jgi:hypothetical protein